MQREKKMYITVLLLPVSIATVLCDCFQRQTSVTNVACDIDVLKTVCFLPLSLPAWSIWYKQKKYLCMWRDGASRRQSKRQVRVP